MCANEIYAVFWDKIKVSCITSINLHLTAGVFLLEIDLFPAPCKSSFVYIDTDDISIQQLCFDESGSAACKLIEYPIAFL